MRSVSMIILLMIAASSFPTGQMKLEATVLSQVPGDDAGPGNEDPNWSEGQAASSRPLMTQPASNAAQDLIPEATEPCPIEVREWWQGIRAAAKAAIEASQRKDEALREAWNRNQGRSKDTDEEDDILSHKKRERLDADISETRARYVELLREGQEKSYRAPIKDRANPIFLYMGRPSYTRLAREKRINGAVTVQGEFRADGMIGEVKVVRGIGYGLDENAVKAIRKIIFLPAVKDGVFLTVTKSPQAEFNVR
jgi:TonB family protein